MNSEIILVLNSLVEKGEYYECKRLLNTFRENLQYFSPEFIKFYCGFKCEFERDIESARSFYSEYKSTLSENDHIHDFMIGYNIEKLYSKLKLAKYFDEQFFEIEKRAVFIEADDNRFSKFPVFIYWGQGFEKAPNLVKICYNRAKEIVQTALISLSEQNIREYIEIPEQINIIRRQGQYAAYSDYIRTALITKYGGCWIDATVFVGNKFYMELQAYNNNKTKNPRIGQTIFQEMWFRASKQKSHLGERIVQAAYEWWYEENEVPFYFFGDFMTQYFRHFGERYIVQDERFPLQPSNKYDLRKLLGEIPNNQKLNHIFDQVIVSKLSYKNLPFEEWEKEDTVYAFLKKIYLEYY